MDSEVAKTWVADKKIKEWCNVFEDHINLI